MIILLPTYLAISVMELLFASQRKKEKTTSKVPNHLPRIKFVACHTSDKKIYIGSVRFAEKSKNTITADLLWEKNTVTTGKKNKLKNTDYKRSEQAMVRFGHKFTKSRGCFAILCLSSGHDQRLTFVWITEAMTM